MDAFLPALVSAAPQLGVAGILLIVLYVIMRSGGQDRADYRAQLEATVKRHADEIGRINKDHADEIAELKADVKDLRKELGDVQAALDLEREARRRAEDMAAEALRKQRGRAS